MKTLNWLLLIIVFLSCGPSPSNFSESELSLLKNLQFEQGVLSNLKQDIHTEFTQFEISDPGYIIRSDGEKEKTGVEKKNGISFKVPEKQSDKVILNHKDYLKQNGYLIFLSESGYESPSIISIIKAEDKFDILRIQKTDGINFDLENDDIIKRLKIWDETYGIEILGADYDWVDFIFIKDIKNPSEFAQEVYDFCPDSVDQGVGEITILEQILQQEKRLFLWWD
ncbi:DUF4253 domain-containing protein [Spongiivirga citrea]|uniref:DUF4253 domain-containing protein n=1 Tax=Spongiivirga citrea TaxID=1481457 RepID=A0A6M0CP55_9FLAO|nr:DUF4253 domain-containing protein [Spongiivirga citrea]NER17257.1 DUF4253 domain-containing protein [Spongiivirga citrea]